MFCHIWGFSPLWSVLMCRGLPNFPTIAVNGFSLIIVGAPKKHTIAMYREQQTFNKSACDVHLRAIWNLDEAQNKLTIADFLQIEHPPQWLSYMLSLNHYVFRTQTSPQHHLSIIWIFSFYLEHCLIQIIVTWHRYYSLAVTLRKLERIDMSWLRGQTRCKDLKSRHRLRHK